MGTAIGELPPYFMARAARLSGVCSLAIIDWSIYLVAMSTFVVDEELLKPQSVFIAGEEYARGV